jgi:heme A synthase
MKSKKILFILFLLVVCPVVSYAKAKGFGSLGVENVVPSLASIGQAIYIVGIVIGLYMVVHGISNMLQVHKNRGSMTTPVSIFVCGLMLLSLSSFLAASSGTFFGSTSEVSEGLDALDIK